MKITVTISLTFREALRLLEETKDILIADKPILHELLDRLEEIVEGFKGY